MTEPIEITIPFSLRTRLMIRAHYARAWFSYRYIELKYFFRGGWRHPRIYLQVVRMNRFTTKEMEKLLFNVIKDRVL